MGSSLRLSLANAFLAHYEKICFNNFLGKFKPVHYKRNVFDIFLVFFLLIDREIFMNISI